jgi:phage terminase large subunit-like protein
LRAVLPTLWRLWARVDQWPPDGAWTTWLILGGRGAGKTRAGAEWVRMRAEGPTPLAAGQARRIALVGETWADARDVMVEGESGLKAIAPAAFRPTFEPSRRRVVWPNGAVAMLFSAEDPDSLRGPQFDTAWADEIGKWRHGEAAFDMLQFGLRLGDDPRQVVTTTPRPVPLVRRLLADPNAVIARAATVANRANLAPAFLARVVDAYAGTRLGRQELDAELLEDNPDALWQRAAIEAARVRAAPDLRRVVVAVDPPVSTGAKADACGIVVCGLGADGCGYVLADRSVQGASPSGWAARAVDAYRAFAADRLVAEANQGGDLVEAMIRQVDAGVAYRAVRASRGKAARAEPVAALYERGLVRHAGAWPELEDQMCDFAPTKNGGGLSGGGSPDRVDALVWALTELMLKGGAEPRVRGL